MYSLIKRVTSVISLLKFASLVFRLCLYRSRPVSYTHLDVYKRQAYYTPTKQVYCAIWSENMAGRAGNDIASAFAKILNVSDENDFTHLITWSDSCVPQNLLSSSVFTLPPTF